MAVKTYTWVTLWFILIPLVEQCDGSLCFKILRHGGDLRWIWEPYNISQIVRNPFIIFLQAPEEGDQFANSQALMNVIETVLSFLYFSLTRIQWPPASLVGFASAIFTLTRPIMYWTQGYHCNYCMTEHNDSETVLSYLIIPSLLWVIVPSIIIYVLGRDICAQLRFADRVIM
ncbi:hypothetical protein GYMLUDRAFT_181225 [Collybiopsis luxurians FD-317 M1]|uniref:Unplaced genomic scaffold GYMLUscaffold_111, whole genome shotgun sequence n=1 Tax=Collybiopsis luxurians FD-317 M1 TaxID=944289 RepID=A0A0D0BPR8_9AGAR|nr:hypothetical protein GYMLUDRAFT_181225 [Collybiopsis luxurians FD-317 M1]